MLSPVFAAALSVAGAATGSPVQKLQKRATNLNPVISSNSANPSILQDSGGTWYQRSERLGP